MQPEASEPPVMHKVHLMEWAAKDRFPIPKFNVVNHGSVHRPSYQGQVTIGGVVIEAGGLSSKARSAEGMAAKRAMSVLSAAAKTIQQTPPEPVRHVSKSAPQDGGLVKWTVPWLVPKSVLQEVLQKLHLPLPIYSTTDVSSAKMPLYAAEARLFDHIFRGEPKKSKRDAEASAAEKAILSFLQGVTGRASVINDLSEITSPDVLKKLLLEQIPQRVPAQQMMTRIL